MIQRRGNLLVAESGGAPNTGRVSIVDQFGNRRTPIDGLPSGISAEGGGPSSPQGLDLRGRTLFVANRPVPYGFDLSSTILFAPLQLVCEGSCDYTHCERRRGINAANEEAITDGLGTN
jgi:hypothetical protein